MVRLMLVLAPVMCIMGGLAVSSLLNKFMGELRSGMTASENKSESSTGFKNKKSIGKDSKQRTEVSFLT